jgi:hypothetical protein
LYADVKKDSSFFVLGFQKYYMELKWVLGVGAALADGSVALQPRITKIEMKSLLDQKLESKFPKLDLKFEY